MNEKFDEKLKDFVKFIIALFFVALVLFLNLAYWTFIVIVTKWILTFFIPDIGWKIPIFATVVYYILRNFGVRVVKRK